MKNKTFNLKAFTILAVVVAFAACSKKVAPVETTETYTGPEVSYAKDIAPLVARSCAPCHFPEKDGKKIALDDYKSVKQNLSDMLQLVQLPDTDEHFMPFKKKKQPLSAEEIELWKNWARGGFLE
jgi:hypothetical protein